MIFKKEDIEKLDTSFRRTFINSLAGFRQAVLVGTKSIEGVSNLAIFNSLIHIGANPALFGLISRPDIVQRDTLKNIMNSKEYTLNYIKSDRYKEAHQTSARYEKGISEFEKVGFVEEYKSSFYSPFIQDAVVKIAMKFEQKIDIELNGTVLIIGSLQYVEMNNSILKKDGFVSLSEESVLVTQGLDAYFAAEKIARLPYAKPND